MSALGKLWRWLFGCTHARTTWPMERQQRPATSAMRTTIYATYVVCLECGKEIPYDRIRFARKPPQGIA